MFVQQIRRKMIDGQTGNYTISTLVKSQDEVSLFWKDIGVYYSSSITVITVLQFHKKMFDKLTKLFPLKRYIDLGQRTYTFAPVKGTDYRWITFA